MILPKAGAPMEEYIYDAFISYSHRDMKWARWLQRCLETFRIPRGLCPGAESRRHLKVFRDQTDLAGVELQQTLEKELDASRCLVVLCSPNSAASHWVNEEILAFRREAPGRRIIPFIVDGEPESDDASLECYPPALRSGEGHPLGSNVREIGKDKAFLKLVSILLDIRFNRLVDREKQRRLRTALTAGFTAAAVALTVGGLLRHNALVTRKNRELSYDIYGAAIISIAQKDVIEPADVEFLRVSAEAGNNRAMLLLADCYNHGWGTEPDPEAAFAWFSRAAEAGDTSGMVGVANCYDSGVGTAEDKALAYQWDLRAAEAGDASGMLNTAICLEDGSGTEKDEKAAFEWYKKSAETGFDLGMYNLARCYLAGVGTEPDSGQAFAWTRRLADTGNVQGMYNLAMMYQYGFGTEEDPRQAYLWYRKAAEAGDADAMYAAGQCAETGYGTDGEAAEWYRRAYEAGKTDAAADLERLAK